MWFGLLAGSVPLSFMLAFLWNGPGVTAAALMSTVWWFAQLLEIDSGCLLGSPLFVKDFIS